MPEALEPPVQQTQLQTEIAARTAAAVQDTGFGKEFDLEVDAAIASDNTAREAAKSGKVAPAVAPPSEKKAEAVAPAAMAAPGLDIPESLLGEKAKPAGELKAEKADAAEAENIRQKEIEDGTKGLSPKAADRFRALEAKKHEAEQRASRLPDLERKLAEAEKKLTAQPDNSELERYKAQVEELDAVVKKRALAEHPKFKAHYDDQIEKEVASAAKILTDPKAAAEVQALLSLPETAQRNRRLNEIAGELEPVESAKFLSAVDRADRLSAEKSTELNNWKVNGQRLAEMSRTEQTQTTEQRQRMIDGAVKAVQTEMGDAEKGIELFRKVDGNDEWNKAVDTRLEYVKKITAAGMEGAKAEDVAKMAAWALSGNEYRKLFLTQRALVLKLQAELKDRIGGEPDLGTGDGDAADDTESGSMIDVLTRAAQKQGVVR